MGAQSEVLTRYISPPQLCSLGAVLGLAATLGAGPALGPAWATPSAPTPHRCPLLEGGRRLYVTVLGRKKIFVTIIRKARLSFMGKPGSWDGLPQ